MHDALYRGRGNERRDNPRLKLVAKEDEEYGHMPDYCICIDGERNQLVVQSRGTVGPEISEMARIPALDPEVYDMARQAAPSWDVRMIEQEWRRWATEMPRNPEMACLGFCRKWAERRGRP